jgi:hypothetical protein
MHVTEGTIDSEPAPRFHSPCPRCVVKRVDPLTKVNATAFMVAHFGQDWPSQTGGRR